MNSGVVPTPIRTATAVNGPIRPEDIDHLIKEAFRQGWESSRHWPNHPIPNHLFVKIQPRTPDTIVLRIEWP